MKLCEIKDEFLSINRKFRGKNCILHIPVLAPQYIRIELPSPSKIFTWWIMIIWNYLKMCRLNENKNLRDEWILCAALRLLIAGFYKRNGNIWNYFGVSGKVPVPFFPLSRFLWMKVCKNGTKEFYWLMFVYWVDNRS